MLSNLSPISSIVLGSILGFVIAYLVYRRRLKELKQLRIIVTLEQPERIKDVHDLLAFWRDLLPYGLRPWYASKLAARAVELAETPWECLVVAMDFEKDLPLDGRARLNAKWDILSVKEIATAQTHEEMRRACSSARLENPVRVEGLRSLLRDASTFEYCLDVVKESYSFPEVHGDAISKAVQLVETDPDLDQLMKVCNKKSMTDDIWFLLASATKDPKRLMRIMQETPTGSQASMLAAAKLSTPSIVNPRKAQEVA